MSAKVIDLSDWRLARARRRVIERDWGNTPEAVEAYAAWHAAVAALYFPDVPLDELTELACLTK